MSVLLKLFLFPLAYVALCYFYLFDVAKGVSLSVDGIVSPLMTLSTAVLAIVGMWISYSYPAAVQHLAGGSKEIDLEGGYESAKRLEALMMSLLTSICVLLLCVLGKAFVIPIGKSLDLYLKNAILFKGVGYCSIWFLCILQSYSLLKVLGSNFAFLTALEEMVVNQDLKLRNNPKR